MSVALRSQTVFYFSGSQLRTEPPMQPPFGRFRVPIRHGLQATRREKRKRDLLELSEVLYRDLQGARRR